MRRVNHPERKVKEAWRPKRGAARFAVAADAAANALVPGSGIVLKGIRAFGDASQEARRAGATIGQQVAYGGLTAGKDVVIEKTFDGFGGIYGKGVADKAKWMQPVLPHTREALEAGVLTLTDPMLKSIYNDKPVYENYSSDVFADAIKNAVIKGAVSGTKSVWDDAWDQALNKTMDTLASPQTQAKLRKAYIGTPRADAEDYAALIRLLYVNAKGDGRRW